MKRELIDTIIIDNGSSNFEEIEMLASESSGLELISLQQNFGIAYAQNLGLKSALAGNYEFALLLDQDSLPETGFVARAKQAFSTLDPDGKIIAAVAPSFVDSSTGYLYPFVRFSRFTVQVFRPSLQYEEVSLIISSGSMLRLGLLPAIGLMNELFFIDHVDTEWCLRVIANGYRLIGVKDNLMSHSVGDATIRIAGRNLPSHNPRRRYLATRNLYYLIFFARAPLQWKIKEATTSVLKMIVVLPFIKYRLTHLHSFLLGAIDGISSNFSRGNK
jgi:rhamnosyltransferase